MYLKQKTIKEFELNEEQSKKISEMKDFAFKMKFQFKEDSFLYKLNEDYQTFLGKLLAGYGFADNGELFSISDNKYSHQPFLEKGDS